LFRPCSASPYSTKPSNGSNESNYITNNRHSLAQTGATAGSPGGCVFTHPIMLTILFIISLLAFAYMLYVLIRPERF